MKVGYNFAPGQKRNKEQNTKNSSPPPSSIPLHPILKYRVIQFLNGTKNLKSSPFCSLCLSSHTVIAETFQLGSFLLMFSLVKG